MIIIRRRSESDANEFLHKLKKMKKHLEDVIECVEHIEVEDGDEEYEEEDYVETSYRNYQPRHTQPSRYAYRKMR